MTTLETLAKPLVNAEGLAIEKLQKYYTFRNEPEVIAFIEKYPFLLEVLEGAPQEISKYFPGDRLELEYYVDPEYSTEHPGDLVLHIMILETETKTEELLDEIELNTPDEKLDQLHILYDNWWLKASDRCEHRIFIVLSYYQS